MNKKGRNGCTLCAEQSGGLSCAFFQSSVCQKSSSASLNRRVNNHAGWPVLIGALFTKSPSAQPHLLDCCSAGIAHKFMHKKTSSQHCQLSHTSQMKPDKSVTQSRILLTSVAGRPLHELMPAKRHEHNNTRKYAVCLGNKRIHPQQTTSAARDCSSCLVVFLPLPTPPQIRWLPRAR